MTVRARGACLWENPLTQPTSADMESVMTSQHETLTQLVAGAIDDGLTYRSLEAKAIDPQTGYKPGRTTIWKVAHGEKVHLTPELVRAIAAGLSVSPARAAEAAAVQYAGYVPQVVSGATAVRHSQASASNLEPERNLVDQWDKEADAERNRRSG